MRLYNYCGVVVAVFTIVTFLIGSCHSFDISLHECPCKGPGCERVSQQQQLQEPVWATFHYGTLEGETKSVRFGLTRGSNGNLAHCESEPSELISVSFLNPENAAGDHGELHGLLEATGQSVSLEINEEGVLSYYANGFNGTAEKDFTEEHFTKESYCIRRTNASHSTIEICCGGQHKKCIRKCCPHGQMMLKEGLNTSCVESSTGPWDVPTVASSGQRDLKLRVRTGFPKCEEIHVQALLSTSLGTFNISRTPYERNHLSFRLYPDGTLKYFAGGTWRHKSEDADYCVDQLVVPEEQSDMTCGEDEKDILVLCIKSQINKEKHNDWIYRVVYMTGFVIAIIVLLATAIVHFLLWEKQNSHAWTILCYVVTLTFFYACLLTIYVEETRKRWSDHYIPFIPKEWCLGLGVITHFMGIFSFAWLSVINFDLWWTFRILKPMNQRNLDVKRLLAYASFALAVPTAVVSIAYAFQISYMKRSEPCRKTEEDPTSYPRYGEDTCFLANSSQPYYFYIPVGILLLANLIFYLCTSCQMLRIYNATRRISSDRSSRKQKQSCELFLKLFLVMGTTWIFQVILSVVEKDVPAWYSPFFAVLDLVNMFQAIAIFVIFVCKRETLRALENKYGCLKACLHPFRGVYRTPTIISRSTDGSTKMSRADCTKSYIDGGGDRRRDSELISFT